MKQHIDSYLESKRNAWSASTLSSERPRLNAVSELLDGDANKLWNGLADRAPYTRLTIWVRVTDFYEWLIDAGKMPAPNPYKIWKQSNAKVFKNTYQPKTPTITFEEACARIEGITDAAVRKRAFEIIGAGTRWAESCQTNGNTVVGKGGTSRRVYRPNVEGPAFERTYATFRRVLAEVGLKPHTLRKLCATQLVRSGMNEADLCKAMGWASFATARCYIAPVAEDAMAEKFAALQLRKTK